MKDDDQMRVHIDTWKHDDFEDELKWDPFIQLNI